MASDMGSGRALPKFGEWDVNNPASSEGFTVIFQKARDEKKTGAADAKAKAAALKNSHSASNHKKSKHDLDSSKKKWFQCFSG